MGRTAAGLRICLVPLIAAAPAAAAEPPAYSHQIEVAVALYQVRVLDADRCIAGTVRNGDVVVFAGDQALPTRVRRARGPLRLIVVLDASFSMVGRRLTLAEEVASRLLERLARERAGHLAGVAVFDEQIYWLTEEGFSADLCAAAATLTEPVAGGGTALWRGLDAAYDLIELAPAAAPTAIVVLTDGQDNSDRGGELSARVRARARAAGVPIFAVAIPPRQAVMALDEAWPDVRDVRCSRGAWAPRRLDRERERLLAACTESGGAMYAPRNAAAVREAVDFLYAQVRDLHWVEADIPPAIAARRPPLTVSATRPGTSVLFAGASR